jgi:hypothetical protein
MEDKEKVFWLSIAASFITGVSIGSWITPNKIETASAMANLELPWFQHSECKRDKQDSEYACITRLEPRKMTLEFVTRDRFDSMTTALDTAANYKIGGFARINKSPCEIVIPIEGAELESRPYSFSGYVNWGSSNYNIANTIAHEILHCYTGRWHADYIPALQFRSNLETNIMVGRYDAKFGFSEKFLRLQPQTWDLRPAYAQTSPIYLAQHRF